MDNCTQCHHPKDPHVLIATDANGDSQPDITLGGIMLCPVPGCPCFTTWCPHGMDRSDVHVPDDEQITHMRAVVQRLDR